MDQGAIANGSASEYPDASQVNRRPPVFRRGKRSIYTECETKVFAVCGDSIAIGGYITKVWNLMDNQAMPIYSKMHGETVKVTAIAFKPARDVNDEGKRLWLGTSFGEMLEVDVLSGQEVYIKSNAHSRSQVIRLYRHAADIWSLDDDGRLHIWPPDDTGSPNLAQTPHSFRLTKVHSFSMLVGNYLWHASGKDIRAYQYDARNQTLEQANQQIFSTPGAGDVTSGTTISSQPDRVYFGHNDGKISIYSRRDYSLISVVNASVYWTTSLAGVGDYLWAAYNTGMIYVYDTSKPSWVVKKDWKGHGKSIFGLHLDPTSLWKLDRLQVATLGADNFLKVWDGMLEDDWLG